MFSSLRTRLVLFVKNGIYYGNISSYGGMVDLKLKGKISLPRYERISFVNNSHRSTLGISRPCKLYVYENAELIFKGKAGLSNSVIVATKRVEIGKNVMIGGGVIIVDSDFHSLDYTDWFSLEDNHNMKSSPVSIGDNVFIGMNSLILKGVKIGSGAVVGAGSVVTQDIPSNEVWAGNPAKFIKKR